MLVFGLNSVIIETQNSQAQNSQNYSNLKVRDRQFHSDYALNGDLPSVKAAGQMLIESRVQELNLPEANYEFAA